MQDILDSFFINMNIDPKAIFIAARAGKSNITLEQMFLVLLQTNSASQAIRIFDRSEQTFNRAIKRMFPDVKLAGGGQTWKHWIRDKSDYKSCHHCEKDHFKTNFHKNKGTYDGLAGVCKDCAKIKNKTYYNSERGQEYHRDYWAIHGADARLARNNAMAKATPKWADLSRIAEIYKERPAGYDVDHYYPLRGRNVCGLHVENNLCYLAAGDNSSKSNKHPETENFEVYWNALECPPIQTIKKIKEIKIRNKKLLNKCITCAKELSANNTGQYCVDHYNRVSEVGSKITVEEIEYWVTNFSWSRASRELGMSDNGLRKAYTRLTGSAASTIKSARKLK